LSEEGWPEDYDFKLEFRVRGALINKHLTIALAESCTGGLLASMLTDLPGASEYFLASYVTYSNGTKVAALGVPWSSIHNHGAVSEEVARGMATGARKAAGADIGVGITGIAGPGGGSEEKPVGLVYIALDMMGEVSVVREVFPGDRMQVKIAASVRALEILDRALSG